MQNESGQAAVALTRDAANTRRPSSIYAHTAMPFQNATRPAICFAASFGSG